MRHNNELESTEDWRSNYVGMQIIRWKWIEHNSFMSRCIFVATIWTSANQGTKISAEHLFENVWSCRLTSVTRRPLLPFECGQLTRQTKVSIMDDRCFLSLHWPTLRACKVERNSRPSQSCLTTAHRITHRPRGNQQKINCKIMTLICVRPVGGGICCLARPLIRTWRAHVALGKNVHISQKKSKTKNQTAPYVNVRVGFGGNHQLPWIEGLAWDADAVGYEKSTNQRQQ